MKMLILLCCSVSVLSQDAKLQDLLDKILAANGGNKREILAEKCVLMSGNMTMSGQEHKGTWKNDFAPGGKMVFENRFMGQSVLMKSDGTSTWSAEFDPDGKIIGYQELQGTWAKMGAKFGNLNALFMDFEANGVRPVLREDADWNGKLFHVIEYHFVGLDDLFMTVYFDRESFLPHVQKWSIGPPYILEDYRFFEGIPFPYKRSQKVPQGTIVMQMTDIKMKDEIDHSIFSVD